MRSVCGGARCLTIAVALGVAAATLSCRGRGAGAASDGAAPSAQEHAAVVPDDWTLSMERTPCFGACPTYTVTVDAQGVVRYAGTRFVADTGTRRDTVSAAVVAALDTAAVQADLFAMEDRYGHGVDACTGYVTDQPGIFLHFVRDGREKDVMYDTGCQGAPAALRPLAARIDSLLGTARWTGRR